MDIELSSDAFRAGGSIPVKYTCDGLDRSPPLSWTGVPANAKSLVLIMEDPDAQGGKFAHWVLYNILPHFKYLPEGIPRDSALMSSYPVQNYLACQGINDFGRTGYGGPCPPKGETHRYYFRIYALDGVLNMPEGASKMDVERAMKGHILAKGEIMGIFGR